MKVGLDAGTRMCPGDECSVSRFARDSFYDVLVRPGDVSREALTESTFSNHDN